MVLIVATWAELSAATAAVLRPAMLTLVSAPSSSAVIPLAWPELNAPICAEVSAAQVAVLKPAMLAVLKPRMAAVVRPGTLAVVSAPTWSEVSA